MTSSATGKLILVKDPSKLIHLLTFKSEGNPNLKAVYHVPDWPQLSALNTTNFFVNLRVSNKGELIAWTVYGRRKSEDQEQFKYPILCIVLIAQSNA